MPRSIGPFTINSASWTAYIPSVNCWKIIVSEVDQAGTVDYSVAYPTTSDGPRVRPAGKEFVYQPGWLIPSGVVAFHLKSASGSVSFDADEQ